jgi:heat-inducible transcriptional repressor
MGRRTVLFHDELNDRDRQVLRLVVQHYVVGANPVGSEFLVRHDALEWSSATVRNTFARLEELGYIEHPHTSAGRVPTQRGYRFFVDTLGDPNVHSADADAVRGLDIALPAAESVLRAMAQIIARISGQISLIAASYTDTGILHRIELLPLSSTRVLVVLAVRSGFVRSVVLEISSDIPARVLERVAALMNEQLSGRPLAELRSWCDWQTRSADGPEAAVIRHIRCSPKLFDDAAAPETVFVSGTGNVVRQPEFRDGEGLQGIVELIDDSDAVRGMLGDLPVPASGTAVTIGREHHDARLHACSTITALFRWGDVLGRVGVLGPTRLPYDRLAPLVAYVARTLSRAGA